MEQIEKQEKAYEEALWAIEHGSVFYAEQIQKTKKEIRELARRDSNDTRGLSAKQIADKKEYLEGQVAHFQKKQGELVEKQNAIKGAYHSYKKSVEKRGAQYFGDVNLISNLSLARGIEPRDVGKDKITATFKKDFGKIEKEVNDAFATFDKTLTREAAYVINNDGKQVFRKSDFSDQTFKDMTIKKHNQIEQNYPKEQSLEQLEQEKNDILGSIDGYNQIQEVMNPENEFNISDSMKKDLDKCSELYGDISKHKLIVKKIEEVLDRFEVDDKDKSQIDENKKDRSKEYAKLCKTLHKLKQKEEKTIKKLENKVRKPMAKNNVQKLCGLVEDRKIVEGAKSRIGDLEMQISSKESELTVLLSVRSEIGKDRSDLEKFSESKNIQEKIDKLEKEIQEAKVQLQESKTKLEQSQLEKTKHSNELRQYTTKEFLSKEESYITKDIYSELRNQTASDIEYIESSKQTTQRNLEKKKDEQNMTIE